MKFFKPLCRLSLSAKEVITYDLRNKAVTGFALLYFGADAGLCVHCGAPGCIVHHKTELTPQNIDDPMITLNEDNLETVCRTCHAIIHEGTPPLAGGLAFDADGNVIEAAVSPGMPLKNPTVVTAAHPRLELTEARA